MLIDSVGIATPDFSLSRRPTPAHRGWISRRYLRSSPQTTPVTILSLIELEPNGERARLTSARLNWLNFEPPSDHPIVVVVVVLDVVPCSSRSTTRGICRVFVPDELFRRIIISIGTRWYRFDKLYVRHQNYFEFHVMNIALIFLFIFFITIVLK